MTRLRTLSAALLTSAALALSSTPPAEALNVFDPANYSQNLLTAVRTLEMIGHQIRQLQNEAQMLINMARQLESLDFSSLAQLDQTIGQIDGLIEQAGGLAFEIASVEQAFAELYPEQYGDRIPSDDLADHARERWMHVRSALEHAMRTQAEITQGIADDRSLIEALVGQSQGAVGMLQAQQAANQLIAHQSTQMIELQQLLAAQGRADALELARQTAAEERAREQLHRFLGDGDAYAPTPVTIFSR